MRTLPKGVLAASLCLAGVGGAGAGYYLHRPNDSAAYVRYRPEILLEQARHETPGLALVIGDSITERSGLHRLCGADVFNAGVSSATLTDITPMAAELTKALKPSRVVVAIGTNDAKKDSPADPAVWRGQMVNMLRSLGRPVYLVPVPVIVPNGDVSKFFSEDAAQSLNQQLPEIARKTGASVLPRPTFPTDDGVHPTKIGAAEWRAVVSSVCA